MRYNEKNGHWPLLKLKRRTSEPGCDGLTEKGGQVEEIQAVEKEELNVSAKVQEVGSST